MMIEFLNILKDIEFYKSVLIDGAVMLAAAIITSAIMTNIAPTHFAGVVLGIFIYTGLSNLITYFYNDDDSKHQESDDRP